MSSADKPFTIARLVVNLAQTADSKQKQKGSDNGSRHRYGNASSSKKIKAQSTFRALVTVQWTQNEIGDAIDESESTKDETISVIEN